jgi:hypothetical protein
LSATREVGFGDAEAGLHVLAREGDEGLALSDGSLHRLRSIELDGGQLRDGDRQLQVELEPLGEPTKLADGATHQLCRAKGTALGRRVDCVATLVNRPQGSGAALQRDIAVRIDDDIALAVHGRRKRSGDTIADEQLQARVGPGEWREIEETRISSTYGGDGELVRAGLELWESEESDFALRLGGEVLAAATLGDSQVALCVWRYAGKVGSGHYILESR